MSESSTNRDPEHVVRVGPYEVKDVLGRGPHGTVYAVLHVEDGRRHVLKRLHQPMAGTRPGAEFSRIARVTAALAHPAICDVSQMLLHGGHVAIVSEPVSGRSLSELIVDRGALDPVEVVSLARQVCMGLQYAHQRCVYHTSLHPGNVFLLEDGSVKLSDMAIAALYGYSVGQRAPYGPRREAFLAPEFLTRGVMHSASDIFSLGVLLYSALTGALSFSHAPHGADAGRFSYLEVGSAAEMVEARSGPDLERLPAGTPEVLRHTIATAVSPDPADRPGSVNAVAAVLKGVRSAPIAARMARDSDDLREDTAAERRPRSRVCRACRRPVSPAGRVCLACGLVLRAPDEEDEAINYFQQHGRRLLTRHDLTAAERAYRRAIERDPNQAVLYNELGDVLAVGNRFDEAVRAYHQALKLRPDDDDAWHDLGLSLAALHRRAEAARALKRAIELTRRDEVRLSARIHLGALAAAEGRQQEAIALWQQVLAEDPGLSAVRLAMASSYASQGMFPEAQDQLRAVLGAEPDNRQAQNLLARVRERSQLERRDADSSYGVIDDFGGADAYLGVGFRWARWL